MNSGDWAGAMVSNDQGDTWSMIPGFPVNYYITAILEPEQGTVLISAQSHLYNAQAGGIWTSKDLEHPGWKQVSTLPTFSLTPIDGNRILATHARLPSQSISVSLDTGYTWEAFGTLGWKAGTTPFYTCAAVVSAGERIRLVATPRGVL